MVGDWGNEANGGTCAQVRVNHVDGKMCQGRAMICVPIGSPVGGPHSLGEIRGAAAVNVLSRLFAFAAHGGALGQERR